jgi:hypothetical protein
VSPVLGSCFNREEVVASRLPWQHPFEKRLLLVRRFHEGVQHGARCERGTMKRAEQVAASDARPVEIAVDA